MFFVVYFTDFFSSFPLGWETFVEHSVNGFLVLDANFNVINFNSRFFDFGGQKDLIGTNLFDLDLSDEINEFLKGEGEIKQYYVPTNSWIKITKAPIIEENNLIGHLLIFEDITEDTIKTQNLELLNSVVSDVEKVTSLAINYRDNEGKYFWSDEAYSILERDRRPEDIYTDVFNDISMDYSQDDLNKDNKSFPADFFGSKNFKIKLENGKIKHVKGTIHKVVDSEGNFLRLNLSVQDVTANEENVIALRKSDHEKTVLLKEIHHRVKNNLQLMSSFINLEEKFHSEEPKRINKITKDRINSLALIHERIYNEENMDYITVSSFFKDFDNNLFVFSNYGIEFIRDIPEDLTLHIDTVTPLTLMINELTLNSFKYAFDGVDGDKIIYKSLNSIEKEGKTFVRFEYKDNGVGLPEGYDISTSRSLGWTIITSLSSQLDGEYELINEEGFGFVLEFPLN